MEMGEISQFILAALAVLFIGLSKAGFGGGLGMLTTPLCVLAFDARSAIGILLPLLCAGDIFSLRHYWAKWDKANLKYLLPGVVIGVIIGVQLIGLLSPRQLNMAIGILAVAFSTYQVLKEKIFRMNKKFEPNYLLGIPFGIGTGFTSAVAHGAGPIVSIFLLPQKLPKDIYVGTNVLIFTWVNWIKLPFFIFHNIITMNTFKLSLFYLPLIPIGVWLGVWLNRRFSEGLFIWLVYLFTFLTGLELIFHFDIAALIKRW